MPEAPNEYTYFALPTADKPIPALFFLYLSVKLHNRSVSIS